MTVEVEIPRIDVMIAGAQKAGTSSLARALGLLPGVLTHHTLEFSWFVEPQRFGGPFLADFDNAFIRRPQDGELVLAKSAGVMYVAGAAKRLHEHNAACKNIIVLRDPVERAWSAYWYLRRVGFETASTFEEALDREQERLASDYARFHRAAYLDRGNYLPQIQRMIELFGRDQTRILLLEDLQDDATTTIRQLAAWIGRETPEHFALDPSEVHENAAAGVRSARLARVLRRPDGRSGPLRALVPASARRWVNQRVRQRLIRVNERPAGLPAMSPATRQRLSEHFAPHNDALARFLGRDLGHWAR